MIIILEKVDEFHEIGPRTISKRRETLSDVKVTKLALPAIITSFRINPFDKKLKGR